MKLALFLVGLAAVATAELRLANKIEGFQVENAQTQLEDNGDILIQYILHPKTSAESQDLEVGLNPVEEQVSILPQPEQPQVGISPISPDFGSPSIYPIRPPGGSSILPIEDGPTEDVSVVPIGDHKLPQQESQLGVLPGVEQPTVEVVPVADHKLPVQDGPDSEQAVEPVEGGPQPGGVSVTPIGGNKLPIGTPESDQQVQPIEGGLIGEGVSVVPVAPELGSPSTYPIRPPGGSNILPIEGSPISDGGVSVVPVGGHKLPLPQEDPAFGIQPVVEQPTVEVVPVGGTKLPVQESQLGVQPEGEQPTVEVVPVGGTKLPPQESQLGVLPIEQPGNVGVEEIEFGIYPGSPEGSVPIAPIDEAPEVIVSPIQPEHSILPVVEAEQPAVGVKPVDQNVEVKPLQPVVSIQPIQEPSFSIMPVVEAEQPAVVVQPLDPVVSIQPIQEPGHSIMPVVEEQPAASVKPVHQNVEVEPIVSIQPVHQEEHVQISPIVQPAPQPEVGILPVQPSIIQVPVGQVEHLYEYDATLPHQPKPVYFPPANIIF